MTSQTLILRQGNIDSFEGYITFINSQLEATLKLGVYDQSDLRGLSARFVSQSYARLESLLAGFTATDLLKTPRESKFSKYLERYLLQSLVGQCIADRIDADHPLSDLVDSKGSGDSAEEDDPDEEKLEKIRSVDHSLTMGTRRTKDQFFGQIIDLSFKYERLWDLARVFLNVGEVRKDSRYQESLELMKMIRSHYPKPNLNGAVNLV